MMEIIEVKTKKDRREFVKLPFSIYKGNSYWVPPIIKSAMNDIDPEKNPFFKSCDAKFWILKRNGRTVGRIGAIINHAYNNKTGENYGRITRPEFIDDEEVVDALFSTAEVWIRDQGMEAVIGPLGFSNVDTQGLLVEGFDQMPTVASIYHLPYYKKHFERLNYKKLSDWVEFNLFLESEVQDKALRLSKIVKQRYNLRVEQMQNKKMLKKSGREFFHVLNEAFSSLFSFMAFDDEQIDYILNSYIDVINPEFVHLVRNEKGKMVGGIIPVPSLTKSMQKAKGHVLRGLYSILRSRKKNDTIDLFLTGVLPDYQAKGVSSMLIADTYAVMLKRGMVKVDTTGMLESNHRAIQTWKAYNHIQNKRKRCYIKFFDADRHASYEPPVFEEEAVKV